MQAVLEQGAVGQAGQRVVVSLVVQFRLGVLEAGDVGEDRDEVADLPLAVAHGADGQPTGIEFTVLASIADFALPVAFGAELMPEGGVKSAVVLARGEQAWRLAEGFVFAVAGDLAEGTVDRTDVLLGIGDEHAFGRVLEYRGGQLQLFLHQVAFGDIAGNGQHAVGVADGQRSRSSGRADTSHSRI